MFYDQNSGLLSGGLCREVAVPAGAYGVEPLSVEDLDVHPDSARLWATIGQLRETADTAVMEVFDEGRRDGIAKLEKLMMSVLSKEVPDNLPELLSASWEVMREWFSETVVNACLELKEGD